MQIVKLLQVGKSVACVIPAETRRYLGWVRGTHISLHVEINHDLTLRSIDDKIPKLRRNTSNRGGNELTKATAGLRAPRR